MIYMFLSNNPSSGDINSSILFCFSCFLLSADFFQNQLFRKILSGIPSVSNSLDPDQARQFVGPELGPNCLQKLSAEDISRQRVNTKELVTSLHEET